MKRLRPLILFLLFFFPFTKQVSAAGPVVHAFLTDSFFTFFPNYSAEEKQAFRMGSLFPDIRYLGHISRDKTHYSNIDLKDILSDPSAFFAGMKFHSYVDRLRENFVVQGKFHSLLKDLPIAHKETFLKFLEDEIVFCSFDKTLWIEVFKSIYPNERTFGLEESVLNHWHSLLNLSLCFKPSTLVFFAYLRGEGLFNISSGEVALWNRTLGEKAKTEDAKEYVDALLKMFDLKLKEAS